MFAFISLLALAVSVAGAPAQHKSPEPNGSLAGIISADDYPPEALHQNEQGDVGVLIRVDRTGAVSDCTVEKSSGYVILDLQTCDLIRKRAKFQPARDRHGRAISSETRSHIHWRIAQDAAPSDPWAIRTVINFGDDGKAVACRLELEGAMQPPPGKSLPPCSPDELKRDVSRETRFGGSIDRLVVEERFSLAPIASPQLGPNQALAGRYVLELGIDGDGKLTSCKVIGTNGPPLDWDPCTKAHKEYPARRGADGKAAPFTAFQAVSTVVDVDPKRMPLTGSLQGLIGSNDYPAEALDRNEQGTVGMTLRVDATGAVSDCIVSESSGSAILDKHTCELMRQRARFQPARDRDGRPIASETHGRVTWKIAADAIPSDPWVSRMIAVFAPDGREISCRMELEGALKPPPGTAMPMCDEKIGPRRPKVPGQLPGALATVVLEQRFAISGTPPPALARGDVLVSREVLKLDIDASGNLTSCKVVDRRYVETDADPCSAVDKQYVPRKAWDGWPVPFTATRTTTVYVHIEKLT